MATLDGKQAKSISLACNLCGNGTWKILGNAPAGLIVGEPVPGGKYTFRVIECSACGEYVAFEALADTR